MLPEDFGGKTSAEMYKANDGNKNIYFQIFWKLDRNYAENMLKLFRPKISEGKRVPNCTRPKMKEMCFFIDFLEIILELC